MSDTREWLYDAATTYPDTLADAEAAVGKRAVLHLTGEVVSAGASDAGAYVRFRIDDRWGFGTGQVFVMDLAAFDFDAEPHHPSHEEGAT